MNLPQLTPRFEVEKIVKNNAHFYRLKKGEKEKLTKSVTGYLGVVNKPAIVAWKVNKALGQVSDELADLGPTPFLAEPAAIAALIARARNRPEKILAEAADIGNKAHAYFDKAIKGEELVDIPDEIENCVLAFHDWFDSSDIEVIQGDTPVGSWKHEFGGSYDAIGIKNGNYGVIDFKSSNAIWPEMDLQVGAYALASSELYGKKFVWGLIVRFGKTTPDYETRFTDVTRAGSAFLKAKGLKDYLDTIGAEWKKKKE